MEKGNQADSGAQGTPATGQGATPGGGDGTSAGPGPGTGTQGTPPPQPGAAGGGSQADQSGPERNWQTIDRTRNPDGTTTTIELENPSGDLRYTTTDAQGNVISQEIVENTNTGGYQPPPDEPPSRTYETDGGKPPVGGPEPFTDIPRDPNLPEWKSWRDLPAQDVNIEEGRGITLDGAGGMEYHEGGQSYRHEGNGWVDSQTGERAPADIGRRATGAQWQVENGLVPTQR